MATPQIKPPMWLHR